MMVNEIPQNLLALRALTLNYCVYVSDSGCCVIDIGCSLGNVEITLCTLYPNSTFNGIDINGTAIEDARAQAQRLGASQVTFAVQDAHKLPSEWSSAWDVVISFHCIHDLPFPVQCAKEIRRVVKDNGMFVLLDTFNNDQIGENKSRPDSAALHMMSMCICIPPSLLAGGTGLGCMWPLSAVRDILKEAGLREKHTVCAKGALPEVIVCDKAGHTDTWTKWTTFCRRLNTLRPRQDGRHFVDDIFKCPFLNENVWIPIKISLKFVHKGQINKIPALVQIMARNRPGDKPLSEPMVVSIPTHICVTRPQWVKITHS